MGATSSAPAPPTLTEAIINSYIKPPQARKLLSHPIITHARSQLAAQVVTDRALVAAQEASIAQLTATSRAARAEISAMQSDARSHMEEKKKRRLARHKKLEDARQEAVDTLAAAERARLTSEERLLAIEQDAVEMMEFPGPPEAVWRGRTVFVNLLHAHLLPQNAARVAEIARLQETIVRTNNFRTSGRTNMMRSYANIQRLEVQNSPGLAILKQHRQQSAQLRSKYVEDRALQQGVRAAFRRISRVQSEQRMVKNSGTGTAAILIVNTMVLAKAAEATAEAAKVSDLRLRVQEAEAKRAIRHAARDAAAAARAILAGSSSSSTTALPCPFPSPTLIQTNPTSDPNPISTHTSNPGPIPFPCPTTTTPTTVPIPSPSSLPSPTPSPISAPSPFSSSTPTTSTNTTTTTTITTTPIPYVPDIAQDDVVNAEAAIPQLAPSAFAAAPEGTVESANTHHADGNASGSGDASGAAHARDLLPLPAAAAAAASASGNGADGPAPGLGASATDSSAAGENGGTTVSSVMRWSGRQFGRFFRKVASVLQQE